MDLTKAEDIKKRWPQYTEELYKKYLHDPDNHGDVITHLVFSSEWVSHMRWPKYWSFSFHINHFNEYSGLISFKIEVGLYFYKFSHNDFFCYVLKILKTVFLFSLVTKYVLISSLISSSTHWSF